MHMHFTRGRLLRTVYCGSVIIPPWKTSVGSIVEAIAAGVLACPQSYSPPHGLQPSFKAPGKRSLTMLSTGPAIELLNTALATNDALHCTLFATDQGVVLLQAGDVEDAKTLALLAARAYAETKAGTGLEVGDKRVYVTAKEDYLFLVVGPSSLPWGVFVA